MKILTLGDSLLRQKALPVEKVDDTIRALVADMFAAMEAKNGVGLAAPQVGKLLRLFIAAADDGVRRVFINPHITAMSEETAEREEGCLSIPGIYENITRPRAVTVQAMDERGARFVLEADGMLARIILHENDHLDGLLFLDRTGEDARNAAIARFKRREERRAEKAAQKKARAERIAAKLAARKSRVSA
ncbi:MAG: peptide deformylase [Spirochaetaceae bacterium]|jgi:peptide deformylase|nr:peptide deformylase [Spirochaetaceae bacterium]